MAEQTISRAEMNKKLDEEPVQGDSPEELARKAEIQRQKDAVKADKVKAPVFAPATRELNQVLNTPDYLTQGLEKPTIEKPDVQAAYAQAAPKTTPTLAAQAAAGTFDAKAGQVTAPTPDSTKRWTSQMVAPDVEGAWQGVNTAPTMTSDTAVKQGQTASMSPELLNQLMSASRGQGPSAAQATLQAGMDQAIAAQQAQAATAGGAFNPAILRQQQQQLATATQQTAGQAAAISAQEQQKAMETAAQALAQQRSIESQEQQLTTNLNAEIAKGNFNAANALVQQKQEQRFAGISQQADAINKAVQQGQIDAAKAAELNAQLQTQVELQNSDLAFKASQGDQAAQLEIDALNAQNIDNMMKMGYTYDAAKLQADQYWTSLVTAGRELQANTALGVYDAKRRIDAARAGRAESSGGGGFMDSLMNVGLQVGAGVLTKKLSGDSSGGPKQEQSPSKMGEPAGGGHVTSGKVTNNEQRMAFGGVITQNFACGGTVRPRINMAVGGAVPPPAVASGGPAVHPSILEQQQPTAPVATDTMAAPVPGDSPQNDVVPAQLSPGEIVIPRSAVASGRGGIMSFIDALDKEGKLGEAQAISSTPSYGEVLQAKQKIKKV